MLEHRYLFTSSTLFVLAALIPSAVFAFSAHEPEVVLYSSGQEIERFAVFEPDYTGGVEIAAGDLGSDGVDEILVAQSGGEDATGIIHVLRQDGSLIREIRAFGEGVSGKELQLAVSDIDRDGKDEIVASIPDGNRSLVAIMNGYGQYHPQTAGIFEAFPGAMYGATVSVGNILGDDDQEIVVASGRGSQGLLTVFSAQGEQLTQDILPFETGEHGLTVHVAHTQEGEYATIIVGKQNGGNSEVKTFMVEEGVLVEKTAFTVFDQTFPTGMELASIDSDANGTEELAIAPAGDFTTQVLVTRDDGVAIGEPLLPFGHDFRGGLTASTLQSEHGPLLAVAPKHQRQHGDTNRGERYVEVDLTKQTTYLWENGYNYATYRISSGLPGTPTPEGEFEILKKLETHVYDGRPVYFYPNTKWNLRFKGGAPGFNYYFHTAYWHNNFGNPMSHGCVNMREEEAAVLYEWADLGTPVWIHR